MFPRPFKTSESGQIPEVLHEIHKQVKLGKFDPKKKKKSWWEEQISEMNMEKKIIHIFHISQNIYT